MKMFSAATLILTFHTAAYSQPLTRLPSAGRVAGLSTGNLEANLSPLFDGGASNGAAAPVQTSGGSTTESDALAAANLVAAGGMERSSRQRTIPPTPLAGLPGTNRMLEGLSGVIPYTADKAEQAGKAVDAEGERRAREGAQRQREMEEKVTGEKSNKYPQYPDRTQEERDKDNGRYPKFEK